MKTYNLKDIDKRMSKDDIAISDKEIKEDLNALEKDFLSLVDKKTVKDDAVENIERKRKWSLYQEVKEWISPHPSWGKKQSNFTVKDFVERFKISKAEAIKIIEGLIKDKKLKKSDAAEDVYVAIRICDICGRNFDDWDLQENHHHYYSFGYGSIRHDLESIEFDVCAECFDKLIDAILPLFPKSPMSQMEIYSEAPEHHPYVTEVSKHDSDPY